MKIEFSAAAELEMEQAVAFYDLQEIDLGLEFLNEVEQSVQRIVKFPEAWSAITKRTRRCSVNRFPYSVIYSVQNDVITIIAVMHHRRDPQSWQSRIKN